MRGALGVVVGQSSAPLTIGVMVITPGGASLRQGMHTIEMSSRPRTEQGRTSFSCFFSEHTQQRGRGWDRSTTMPGSYYGKAPRG